MRTIVSAPSFSLLLLLACAGCGSAVRTRTSPTPSVVRTPSSAAGEALRPRPYPVMETPGFTRAVANGTRTRTGAPGARYWTQYARYRIEAELDPATRQVSGRETVRYLNRSPDALPTLFLHLDQNLFAPGAPRTDETPVTGGMRLTRVSAGGRTLADGGDAMGYDISATRLRIRLDAPLAPGDSIELELAWSFVVPPDDAPREGVTGDSARGIAYMIAYWYPRMAVYDDVNGWQIDPYLGNAEFYMGYGDYDVALTMPAGWIVAATGELANASEVLTPQTRDRLAQARRGREVVHIVTESNRGAGRATTAGRGGKLTWRWRAGNVRDFSWGASSAYLWDAAIAEVGDRNGDGRADTAMVHSVYRPFTREWAWDQSAHYAQHSIEFLSRYLWPYAYPQMTALDGPVSCSGMEYPMLTCIGGRRDTLALYSVTVHEFAHMWFPMEVGSDERRFAWQDEGLTRFNQAQGMQDFFRGYDRETLARTSYLNLARAGGEVELMRHGDLYPFGTPAYGVASYEKMATNLIALRALLGRDTFLRAYREYGRRWTKKHPTPFDFFNTFEDVAGRDLDWFWRTWWYETWTLDQAIAGARPVGDRLEVTIEDRGLAPMPVRLAITRTTGVLEFTEVPVDVWLAGARRHTVTLPDAATIAKVEIDPENAFPDIDRTNQTWTRP